MIEGRSSIGGGHPDQERRSSGTLGEVETLVVDKTGTLIQRKPEVVSIVPALGFEEVEVLRMAASLKCSSEHPPADAIVRAAKERNVDLAPD